MVGHIEMEWISNILKMFTVYNITYLDGGDSNGF
jgi:hypothetical protein